jgi:hypothetical protein
MPRAGHPKRRSKPLVKRKPGASPTDQGGISDCAWIQTLASPYLRGYRAVAENRGSLRGYRFLARGKSGAVSRRGFFVGYLLQPEEFEFLQPSAPECLVFAFLEPVMSVSYRRLVAAEGSLLRRTAEYIGWLTHRPPRFAFFENRTAVLVRHSPLRQWPAGKHEHYSRNFFIETLAWLVRSGLVARLATHAFTPPRKQKR